MTDIIAPYIPFPIVDQAGRPTPQFQVWWSASFDKAIANALAAQAAHTAADAANANANGRQPGSVSLTALAALAGSGLVEQTGANAFTDRGIGVGAGTSIPTTADADGRYVRRDQTPAPVYSAYAGQTISNPPTQAQVQATDDAVKALSAAFVSLSGKLQAIHALT